MADAVGRQSRGHDHDAPATVFQTSTMAALLSGVYDGDVTVRALLTHGDFGVGTFNGLDGEMVIQDGVCYRLRADGTAQAVDGDEFTPFAVVTFFAPQRTVAVAGPTTKPEFTDLVNTHISSPNLIHALRVTGHFQHVHTRTVAKQRRPYPPLTEATETQAERTFREVDGTLIGFLTPDYEQGISVAGYHLHFLDGTRSRGGHCLDFTLGDATIEIATLSDVHLSLPHSGAFLTSDLSPTSLDDQVRQAEGS
ncbi:MAG: alpha-acetolactate decarboxylase [Mycobacterium sp.]|nr:alpha-acetolactate decarboxylase [Mycobacterium sp.]